jgi:hypothetical protein
VGGHRPAGAHLRPRLVLALLREAVEPPDRPVAPHLRRSITVQTGLMRGCLTVIALSALVAVVAGSATFLTLYICWNGRA